MSDDLAEQVEHNQQIISRLIDRVNELRQANDRLEERVAELEQVVDPDPSNREYESLSKAEKVHRLRTHLVREAAEDGRGAASMKYREVKALFDGYPSPGHCYDLMEAAANLDGFRYDCAGQNNQGDKRVRVEIDAVNDETLIHAANNATTATPA